LLYRGLPLAICQFGVLEELPSPPGLNEDGGGANLLLSIEAAFFRFFLLTSSLGPLAISRPFALTGGPKTSVFYLLLIARVSNPVLFSPLQLFSAPDLGNHEILFFPLKIFIVRLPQP